MLHSFTCRNEPEQAWPLEALAQGVGSQAPHVQGFFRRQGEISARRSFLTLRFAEVVLCSYLKVATDEEVLSLD